MNKWPYNTVSFRLAVIGSILIAILIAATVSIAGAASLRICYNDVKADTADVFVYIGSTKTASVFPGQTMTNGNICGRIDPLPPPVIRGTTLAYTLRATNSIGEEGTASNALSFRYPTVPGAPTLVSVGVDVP